MDLSGLTSNPESRRPKKIVGRGKGSGRGKTSGRGHKGQGARSGGGPRPGFEGGQMPLQRRVPKRGFHNPFKKRYALVNIGRLESLDAGTDVSPDLLSSRGWAKKNESVKILGKGSLSKALTVRVHHFSAQAQQKIKAAGGTVEVLGNV